MSKPYEKPRILSVTAAHVAELEADNAHLRKEVDFYFAQVTDNARRYQSDLEAIQAENRKLRELIADMLQYVRYPYMVVRPEVLVERARKLGIEVSE